MPRSGAGAYSPPAGQPVQTGTVIDSTVFNNLVTDIGTELTNSIARDGQSPPTANLPMGGFRHTGAGTATARTMLPLASQVQDDALIWGGTGGGTVDVITISTTPATTAHTTGAGFAFIASGANTGAVTLNPNSVGAKAVTKNGSTALAAGDIPSGAVVRVVYDGTRYQLLNVKNVDAGLLAVEVFTSSGTLTKHADADFWIIEQGGGGGAGGGAAITGAGQVAVGVGGGAGNFSKYVVLAPPATATVTIGTGGTGGTGAGGAGNNTSLVGVGLNVVSNGGTGGAAGAAATPPFVTAGTSGAVLSSSTGASSFMVSVGTNSQSADVIAMSATSAKGGIGGQTIFGLGGKGGGSGSTSQAGFSPNGFGSGGGGGCNLQSQAGAINGGNGAAGILIAYQYKSP